MRGNSIFLSAITDSEGEVDTGYFAGYVVTALILGAIPLMVVGSIVSMFLSPEHHFPVQDLGVGIGSVCTGYGVSIAGVGVFRKGDK